MKDRTKRTLKTAGLTVLALGGAAAVAAFLLRDQISRHRRDLFSPHPLRRLAALGYMAGESATIDNVTLLRDFIAWEPRPLLRSRALAIVRRMEGEARLRELEVERKS